jgi:N-methylhydantoinase B/oxoprolinase/acetone carboxylase alpha subunit
LLNAGVHPPRRPAAGAARRLETTTEIYSHVTAAQERQAAEVLQAALMG